MSLGWLRSIPLQLELAAVVVEMSGDQILRLHLSYVKMSVAVAAVADDHILLPCFKCWSLTASFLNVYKSFSSNPSTSDDR